MFRTGIEQRSTALLLVDTDIFDEAVGQTMEWSALTGPAVVAASVSAVVTIAGFLVNRATMVKLHREKLDADKDLAERKFAFDQQLARERFSYDRQQAIFKRRFELAEQVMADAYKLRDFLAFVRNGASFDDEGSTRRSAGDEPESLKHLRDNYFVPIERLQKETEFIGAMFARRHASVAHFGPSAEKAFRNFQQAIHSVKNSASMLIHIAGNYDDPDRNLVEKLRNDIWQPAAERNVDDRVGRLTEDGVALIEECCKPVLEWVDRP